MGRSDELFERARKVIPGGVNSPVRAYQGVGGTPRFIERAEGCRVFDVDGRSYIDYVGSWGPMILGHADPGVLRAAGDAMARGSSFGAPTEREVELAERICQILPAMDMVRLVSSGTEATMSALRLARGVTGRSRILKFEGCYHGHADCLLVGAGSGVATLGIPGSPGVPEAFTELTIQTPFNDLEATTQAFSRWGDEIACVIVEPVAGNMGCIPPRQGFLAGLRQLCTQHGALLIFDEVMTGFRVARGGAQCLYGVEPDLTCLGKVIGGGFPAAAYGGRQEVMRQVAPEGPVYQAGTLSGNPLAVAAGLEVLQRLDEPGVYPRLSAMTQRLTQELDTCARAAGVPLTTTAVGGMFGFFFHPGPVEDFAAAKKADSEAFRVFFHAMLEAGIYLAPSAYEAGFVSLSHGDAEIAATLAAAEAAFAAAAR